jgi:hypothetical protein
VSHLFPSSIWFAELTLGAQFFATVTVTAFVMLVFSGALGVACYANFGKGLAHFRASSLSLSPISRCTRGDTDDDADR